MSNIYQRILDINVNGMAYICYLQNNSLMITISTDNIGHNDRLKKRITASTYLLIYRRMEIKISNEKDNKPTAEELNEHLALRMCRCHDHPNCADFEHVFPADFFGW